MSKAQLISVGKTLAIALVAIYIANNVGVVQRVVGPKG